MAFPLIQQQSYSDFVKGTACGFCGCEDRPHTYPSDDRGIARTACTVCATLIRNQNWSTFIERVVAAFAKVQSIPDDEQEIFRIELAIALMTPDGDEFDLTAVPSHVVTAHEV